MEKWKQSAEVWDPNSFLSSQFIIHGKVFYLPVKDKYMELSSGVNHLPVPTIWKETMQKELEEDFLYQQYTSLDGFQTTKYAVKLYERFLYSRGNIFYNADIDVCMTIGASQAADLALEYLKSIGKKRMLLVGMTYPLYATLGSQYGYQIQEVRSSFYNKDIPTVGELIDAIEEFNSEILVFSYPCNPSGEKYSDEEMDQILQILYEKEIYCIFDCVCNIIMSEKKVTVPEPHILNHKMLKKSIIVNSFSKTESVPGFRIGYIVGDSNLIQFVRTKQVTIMNPPNMPTIAIWITMMFRCLYLSEQYGQRENERIRIIRCFKKMFFATTVLCSQKIRDYVKELVEKRIWDEYERFKKEMLVQERIFESNKAYLTEKLSPFLKCSTRMDTGFNYLIKLKICHSIGELEFCDMLLQEAGVAVFTESGFALKKAKEDDYWVRISLAVPSERFQVTIDRLYNLLEELQTKQ